MLKKLLLREMTWEEIKEISNPETIVVMPTGAIEQHGPHLPIEVDSRLAETVVLKAAQRAAESVNVVVAPTLYFGASSYWMPYAGTMSLELPTYLEVISQLAGSLIHHGFRKILLVNGHGGNNDPLKLAARMIADRTGVAIATTSYWYLAQEKFANIRDVETGSIPGHACDFETSMMMAVRPELVKHERIVDYPTKSRGSYFSKILPYEPKVTRPQHILKNDLGLEGNPIGGTREKGERFLEIAVNELHDFIIYWSENELNLQHTIDESLNK